MAQFIQIKDRKNIQNSNKDANTNKTASAHLCNHVWEISFHQALCALFSQGYNKLTVEFQKTKIKIKMPRIKIFWVKLIETNLQASSNVILLIKKTNTAK